MAKVKRVTTVRLEIPIDPKESTRWRYKANPCYKLDLEGEWVSVEAPCGEEYGKIKLSHFIEIGEMMKQLKNLT